MLNNIRMEPGAVVRGKLSDNVPRPVKGYIVATSVPKPAESRYADENPSLGWDDWTDVEEDGTFEFESFPRGGELQLIGVCEGWISKTTVPDARSFVMGQLFDVNAPTVDVELEMEPTGTLEVEVLAPDGKPLTEGTIGCSPNQRSYKGGSTVLGRRNRSANGIRSQFLPPGKHLELPDEDIDFPFMKPLNENGITILTGLPIGKGGRLYLGHDQLRWKAKIIFNPVDERGTVRFQLPSTKPVKLKLQTELAVE